MSIRQAIVYVLSLPFLVLGCLWFVMFLLFYICVSPILLLFVLIDLAKTGQTDILDFLWETITGGFELWGELVH